MITLFQIDKSGNEIFEKDYSISLVKNKKIVYGVNIPQELKDHLSKLFKDNQLGIDPTSNNGRLRVKIRFHTAVIILLLEKAIKDEEEIGDINIEICNDIDGHFHEIKDMIFKRLLKIIPYIKNEDIIQVKFVKSSLVNQSAKNLREKNYKETSSYNLIKINLEDLIRIIKK